jgi:hypothetical protein
MLARGRDVNSNLQRFAARRAGEKAYSELGFLPCNAYSLSLTTGIPESSLRRKVKRLRDRGWIDIAADKTLTVRSDEVRAHTVQLNAENLSDMMATYECLCAMGIGAG